MSLGRCSCCNRRWRNADQKALAARRQAILQELSGGAPAMHLGPVGTPARDMAKRERHRADSDYFRTFGDITGADEWANALGRLSVTNG